MKEDRNYGIDLLRMVSMYMVCLLHVVGGGGILQAAETHLVFYHVACLIEVATFCAVNCFALISGYVGCRAHFRYVTLFRIGALAVFYNFGITFICYFVSPMDIGISDCLKSLFPICTNQYWYLTSYTIMFFVIPQMNYVLNHHTTGECRKLIYACFMIFCLLAMMPHIPKCPRLDSIATLVSNGYSAIWLAYLYFLGGFIRIYGLAALVPVVSWQKLLPWYKGIKILRSLCHYFTKTQAGYLALYFISIMITFLLFVDGHSVVMYYLGRDPFCRQWLNYNSPTILLASIGLLCYFANLNVSHIKRIIQLASTHAFSVYIIHFQYIIRKNCWENSFRWTTELPIWCFPVVIFIIALVIYLICSLVDFVRLVGLKRILRLFSQVNPAI